MNSEVSVRVVVAVGVVAVVVAVVVVGVALRNEVVCAYHNVVIIYPASNVCSTAHMQRFSVHKVCSTPKRNNSMTDHTPWLQKLFFLCELGAVGERARVEGRRDVGGRARAEQRIDVRGRARRARWRSLRRMERGRR